MYTLKFGRGVLGDLDNSKVQYNKTKAAKTHRSIISNSLCTFLLVDVYRIFIVERHIGILNSSPDNNCYL